MKHIQYGVKHICTDEKGNDLNIFPIKQWYGLDEEGQEYSLKQINDYEELNEKCIRENLPSRHTISLISREVGNTVIEGNLELYDNGLSYEDNENYIAISNDNLNTKNIKSLFEMYLKHKVKITIEFLD